MHFAVAPVAWMHVCWVVMLMHAHAGRRMWPCAWRMLVSLHACGSGACAHVGRPREGSYVQLLGGKGRSGSDRQHMEYGSTSYMALPLEYLLVAEQSIALESNEPRSRCLRQGEAACMECMCAAMHACLVIHTALYRFMMAGWLRHLTAGRPNKF